MVTRTKVTPPVTPRIVQERPRQRVFRYALMLGGLVFVAWLSYEYGRTGAPVSATAPPLQPGEAAQRVSELEEERDALQQQVAELEQRVEQTDRTLKATQARVESLQKAASSSRAAAVPEPAATVIEATQTPAREEQEATDGQLKLENVRLVQTASNDTFNIGFSLMHAGNSADRVTGTVWIAVDGLTNGKPTRLSLKTLSPDGRPFVKMGFNLQQDVNEALVLPDDFRPRNILVEVKPYGDKYTGTSERFAWNP